MRAWAKERGEHRRIKAEFKARKSSYYSVSSGGGDINGLFLYLARKWKRPVREIKMIVKSDT